MKSNTHKKLLQISFVVLLAMTFNSCKRYKPTVIKGRLLNVVINKGVAGEPIALMAVPTGNSKLPDKGRIELTTTTDSEGFFEFVFDGYSPISKSNRPSYAIDVIKQLSKKKYAVIISPYGNNEPQFNLYKYYEDDLLPLAHVRNTEIKNEITIPVVTACNLKIYCYNQLLPNNDTDLVTLKFINQFGTFTYGYFTGKLNGLTGEGTYKPDVVTGETTIRAIISKKSGYYEVRDTTFFVEDKEYNLVYRY